MVAHKGDKEEDDVPPYETRSFPEHVLWPEESLVRWTREDLRAQLLQTLYDEKTDRFQDKEWNDPELFHQTLELAHLSFGAGTPGVRPSRYITIGLHVD